MQVFNFVSHILIYIFVGYLPIYIYLSIIVLCIYLCASLAIINSVSIIFSGKIYRKQKLWHLAEKELESAKKIFSKSGHLISCLKCRLVMEVILGQELGDISITRCNNAAGNDEGYLQKAESSFNYAVDKLKLLEWKSCVSNPKEVTKRDQLFCDALLFPKKANSPKVYRKRQKRSKFDCVDTCRCNVTCVCDDVNCWHCVPFGVMKSKSMSSIIQMKWECNRRNLLLRLLIGKGKIKNIHVYCLSHRTLHHVCIVLLLIKIMIIKKLAMSFNVYSYLA